MVEFFKISAMENYVAVSQKMWNRITTQSSDSTSGYAPQRMESRVSKRSWEPLFTAALFALGERDERMDREAGSGTSVQGNIIRKKEGNSDRHYHMDES